MHDGLRILVVEDEYFLARDLKKDLEHAGMVVLGPEPSVERALARIEKEPDIDAAILDVSLGGELVFPVADALAARRVPFFFATGYHDELVRQRYPEAMKWDKPVDVRRMLPAFERVKRRG